ncbi:MAG: cytochrome c [Chloroflexi bacterium]|nr:cytochrome c [Chloroflexota bacterium]
MFQPSWLATILLAGVLATAACYQKMAESPRYDPLEPSSFFPDGSSARPLPTDTVARGHLRDDPALFTGKVNGADVDQFPFPVTRDVLLRGQERFNIFCTPCHGWVGNGDGMVVQRGFTRPPSFHTDQLRQAPVGHFFDVITNGFGSMPSYAAQIPVRDRWAIVAYIRALQLSQHATLDDVPPEARPQLGPP